MNNAQLTPTRKERKRRPVRERLMAKVVEDAVTGCWEWTASKDQNGYGRISMRCADGKHRPRLSHRVSYEIHVRNIPEGLTLDHLCRNTSCVNPAHLEPVPIGENSLRAPTSVTALHANATHCPKGHPYDDRNTHVRKNRNGRDCRACARDRMRAKREVTR